MFGALYCAIFRTPRFCKSLKFLGTPIASLAPETVRLPTFSILFAMFTGTCGPPEKLSLALVVLSIVLRKIVKLVYTDCELHIRSRDQLMFFLYNCADKKVFHVSSLVSGYTRKYKVDNVPQHDYWSDEFSFEVKRSIINDNDVMAFIYAPFPGNSPVSSVAFMNDTGQLPLDYFVPAANTSMYLVYIKNHGPHMYPEIRMTDKSHDCCSFVKTTSWPVRNVSSTGEYNYNHYSHNIAYCLEISFSFTTL